MYSICNAIASAISCGVASGDATRCCASRNRRKKSARFASASAGFISIPTTDVPKDRAMTLPLTISPLLKSGFLVFGDDSLTLAQGLPMHELEHVIPSRSLPSWSRVVTRRSPRLSFIPRIPPPRTGLSAALPLPRATAIQVRRFGCPAFALHSVQPSYLPKYARPQRSPAGGRSTRPAVLVHRRSPSGECQRTSPRPCNACTHGSGCRQRYPSALEMGPPTCGTCLPGH